MVRRLPRHNPCRAFSYVELCVSMLILSLCLLPGAKLIPALLSGERDLETRYQLSLVAQQNLDAAALALEASFVASDTGGTLSAQGHPDWRYRIVVTVPALGSGRYAVLCSQAWVDKDADTQLDAGETLVRFDLIIANRKWIP
jgi:hypothetical protein